jgi:hypothetical protein
MFKDIIQGIEQNSLYSIIAMLLMIAAFAAIIVRVVRMDRRHLDHMGRLPLDSTPAIEQNGEDRHV